MAEFYQPALELERRIGDLGLEPVLLDPAVRAGISSYALLSPGELADGLHRLATDLECGAWAERHRELLALDELDLGYRLVATLPRP